MGYCFMTVEKVKSFREMDGKYRHNYRLYQPANADIAKADLNEELLSLDGKSYKDAWNDKIKELQSKGLLKKVRSNAVLGLEVVTTFSRDEFETIDIEEWKKDNVIWLNREFNVPGSGTNNVVSVMYHGDEEGNVHIHSFVIPIDERGHLNSVRFIGSPQKMRQLQDSYADVMKKHELQRGLKGSVAKHKDIKRFYTELNHSLYEKAPEPEEGESIEQYHARIDDFVKEKNLHHLQEKKYLERKLDEARTSGHEAYIKTKALERQYRKKEKKLNAILTHAKSYADENDISEQ